MVKGVTVNQVFRVSAWYLIGAGVLATATMNAFIRMMTVISRSTSIP